MFKLARKPAVKLPPEIPVPAFVRLSPAEWKEHCLNWKRNTTPEERMARMMLGTKWVMINGQWVAKPRKEG